MIRLSLCCLFILTILAQAGQLAGAEKDSPINRQVEDFELRDYRGKSHSLTQYKQQKLLVVAFLGVECPLAKLYGTRLAKLAEEFQPRGVGFLGVNSNSQDSITEIAAYARLHKIEFPILKDVGNRLADKLGAVRTPEVFVLDSQRKVRYWGRIDDQYGVGYIRDKSTRNDLRIALQELLDGKQVSKPVTKAVGCHIGRVQTPKPGSKVTYANQISRILQRRCIECHRKGEIAPFALTDYDEVVGWAEMIQEVVRDRRMPPWHAGEKHGKFKNDRHLTDEEKGLIYSWVKNGAPRGNLNNLPKPRKYVTGWQLSQKPDLVIPITKKPFRVQAEGEVRYQYFRVDPGFKEDKWIKAAQLLPGNRAVVHHILAFARSPDGRTQGAGGGAGGYLVGFVPGLVVQPFPPGMAKRIPAGSQLIFQMHYTPIGSEQWDQSKLGLVFADPKEVTHLVTTTSAVQRTLKIPPHAGNHRVTARSHRQLGGSLLLSMMPHMHLRGKSFRYEAIGPGGKSEILLDVPQYDFNWQTAYHLTRPKPLPPGTTIRCIAHFDNSEDNLSNPDPNKTVRWGDQTWEEMMIGYFDIAVPINSAAAANIDQPPSRARQLIVRFDKNGDGKVTRNEVPAKALATFDRLDTNGDKVLTLPELEKSLPR